MKTANVKNSKKGLEGVRRNVLFFKNPKNGNVVCYQRAIQLKLIGAKGVESGILNAKTGRLISDAKVALRMKLITKADLV